MIVMPINAAGIDHDYVNHEYDSHQSGMQHIFLIINTVSVAFHH